MAGKRKESIQDIVSELYNSYLRWKTIYNQGCSDPFWQDGINLNLVRNHILYYKSKIEEMLGNDFFKYPDAYFYPEPPKVPNDFMAVTRVCQQKEILSNKKIPYSFIIKFDWGEALCIN